MTKGKGGSSNGSMLELWRPPKGAGEPVGCLSTTYTFAPGLFDEQCLARFLEIDSEPNREDLAFLLERETRLGGVYAGVLVDRTQAGVEHSYRWDVLPVRVRTGKQHAKLSLLAWGRHVRIIVASANLTEPGYRTNFEVAAAVDLTPDACDAEILAEAVAFLRSLLRLVPGASEHPPEVGRAEAFLAQVERQVRGWKPNRQIDGIRQRLVFTLPGTGAGQAARSSLDDAVEACRRRGGSPNEVWVASPFFNTDEGARIITASLCKLMARGGRRALYFCVPAIRDGKKASVPRLAAPIALIKTPAAYQGTVVIEILPEMDEDKNARPWHAKMLALQAGSYSALMVGSSNFTGAGMGVGPVRNAEANLITIVDRTAYGRQAGELEALWPEMEEVRDPESAEWLGPQPDRDDEAEPAAPVPAGFLAATYRAGDARRIVLRLDAPHLPEEWQVLASGKEARELLSDSTWRDGGRPSAVEVPWAPVQPPDKLLVRWDGHEGFLPINVEDIRSLPRSEKLEQMTADDMLGILAATDPSAAFRAWARRQQPADPFDSDLDSATPVDLDPLRRYDLQATFLHRVRRRARILAQLRSNLQRPAWSRNALEWRLQGMVGVGALADRLLRDFVGSNGASDEALLTLADFLIVLNDVDYQVGDGSLSKGEFEKIFRPFLGELVGGLHREIETHRDRVSVDLFKFWNRVADRCHA